MNDRTFPNLMRSLSGYGMVFVLVVLCLAFSVLTYREQHPSGEAAASQLAADIVAQFDPQVRVLIAASANLEDAAFADRLQAELTASGATVLEVVKGEPRDARRALLRISDAGSGLDVIASNQTSASWLVFADLKADFPSLAGARIVTPRSYRWPTFLKASNLRNIANQIAVIALLAVGMTLVIITGGIDLSVGSLVGLSAVVAARLIRDCAGALDASALGMALSCLAGIGVCGLVGLFSGAMITVFRIPPFIVTLAMMQVARGLAYILARGQSVYQIPESFTWLGRAAEVLNIPNAVLLMMLLYALAHVLMSRMTLGRYLYAVGGNREAARLAGVPVLQVLLFAYVACGLLAGLGGVLMASLYKSAEPSYGLGYELAVIAAVVVGGTSLSGGEGKISGTLVGVFIIAVIQNGMNLMNVEPYPQMVVFGLIILAAALLDQIKRGKWGIRAQWSD